MKNKKTIGIVVLVIFIIAILSFWVWKNLNKTNNEDSETTKIVTSFYPMYIIAENLTSGANNVELLNMADTNVGCLHDYTLNTEDMKKVENADIFISNGLGMEKFIDKIIDSNKAMDIIDSSENIEEIIEDENETNAHIWTSIDNYIQQVKNIAKGLENLNQENKSIYQKNADEYIKKLEELKSKFVKEINLKEKKAVFLNEAFEYLGNELGLDMINVESDHEESTLSAEKLKTIIDTVKKENIQIILIDKNDNRANAETIANETGAKIYELNSALTGTLDKEAFINAMEENLEVLKTVK